MAAVCLFYPFLCRVVLNIEKQIKICGGKRVDRWGKKGTYFESCTDKGSECVWPCLEMSEIDIFILFMLMLSNPQ